jgi:putative hemolysin
MLEWVLVHGSLIAFFILANSFFVAAEFALVSVRETRIEHLIAQNRPGARTALQLKRNIDEFLPAVQFGVTLASLALGGIGEPALAAGILHEMAAWHIGGAHAFVYAHTIAVILAFAAITYFEVLLGELVPKSLALQRAERIALAVAGPVDVFIRMTRPAVKLMNVSASLVLRLFRAPLRGETSAHSPEEIKLMATATRRVGLLPQFQEEMIHRAIELNQVTVSEIMTPRGKIFSLPADMPVEAASGRIIEEQHSRIPVYDPALGREHIIGIVHSKDVSRLMHFRALSSTAVPGSMTLRQVMREALVAPETKPAVEMLEEFKERHRLMAIVVDEFGSTLGLVTAEDVLEQIVGELEDEFDVGRHLSPLAAGESMVLEGSVSLRDLVTQLRWKLPREAGVETLAGLVLWKLGHIPAVDEAVVVTGKRFTVVEMEGNRVARVRVEALAQRELHLRVAADEVRAEEVS